MTVPKIEFNAEMAEKYSAHIRTSIPGYDDMHQMAASCLRCRLAGDARLLVVGAGDGEEILNLKKTLPTWSVTGVDPSAEMLGIARTRLAASGFEAELLVGNIDVVPMDQTFDAATSILIMHFVKGEEGKTSFLREIAKRLKPGGFYLHVELCADSRSPGSFDFQEALNRFQTGKGRTGEEVTAHNIRRANSVFPILPRETEHLFEQAGFWRHALFYKAFNFHGWVMEKRP